MSDYTNLIATYDTLCDELPDDVAVRVIQVVEPIVLYLEARAGVPRPCPRCGGHVVQIPIWRCQQDETYKVVCEQGCGHRTAETTDWQDAWREHEQNCREAEEGDG